MSGRYIWVWLTSVGFVFFGLIETTQAQSQRTDEGLQVLYTFDSQPKDSSKVIRDESGVGVPFDLTIQDVSAVKRTPGNLTIQKSTRLISAGSARKLIDACRKSNEITIEAWVTPANDRQDGPARIVSLSKDTSNRNFTLGQDKDRFDVRLRTRSTSGNGLPSTASPKKAAQSRLTHIVYTRDRTGKAVLYLNGREVVSKKVAGNFSNWDKNYRLVLANEASGDRPWLGDLHLVAVFSRVLSKADVQQHFEAGSQARLSPELLAERQRRQHAHFFETKVAPLLAQRCLECHDASTKQGGLDLSHLQAARAGSDSGKSIVAGQPERSSLLDDVNSDEMPKDREPLSDSEKAILKKWIANGAVSTLDFIDPAVYALGGDVRQQFVQRLTREEYIETVRQSVGVDIEKDALRLLPADLRADGFSNTAYNLNVGLKHVTAYAQLAEMIVQRMDVGAFARKFSSSRKLIDRDNRALIEKMGRWLLRGPLTEQEIASYRGIATTVASTGGDFEDATRLIIEAMLQSPRFVYRIENQHGGGATGTVNQYELASRLSYIVCGAPPDEELLAAADAGTLNRESTRRHVERMLQSPLAKQRSKHFVSQWLHLDRLDNLQPNSQHFPNWQPELADDMKQESLLFFEEIVWNQKRPMSDLLNARVTFLTPRLAKHYGLQHEVPNDRMRPVKVDLRESPERGGILTHGSVLTVGGDEASMVSRGLFVMQGLLRGVVKDPPACVDTTPVPTKAGLTQRGIAESRIANQNCGGCHSKFEPLAFGLEKYDGLGAYHRADKHGNRLRDDGNILVPGAAKAIPYQTSRELMNLLAESERVKETITWKLTQFAIGRPLGPTDAPIVADIHRKSQKENGTYASRIIAITTSDLVQKTRTEMRQQ